MISLKPKKDLNHLWCGAMCTVLFWLVHIFGLIPFAKTKTVFCCLMKILFKAKKERLTISKVK